jgi:streptomycin 6-kinase
VPPAFAERTLRLFPGGRRWLDDLPSRLDRLQDEWALELGRVLGTGVTSVVFDAGPEQVLKVTWGVYEESEHEADVLRLYDGNGAVRLFRDDGHGALLLERLEADRSLWSLPEAQANEVAAGILRRVWRPPPPGSPYRTLESIARRWAQELVPGDPAVEEAMELIPGLLDRPPAPVVLHQDFHHENALAGTREPWLMIDPKPISGEPAYDLAALLRDRRSELARDPNPASRLRRRFDQLTELTGVDRARARGWAIVQTVAWGPGSPGDFTEEVVKLIAALKA